MSDFVSEFWYYYVAGLTILSLVYCAWVLMANMTKKKKGPAELHGHVWDGDLTEYNNPLPLWWFYMFWLTIIFAVVYLVMYPTLSKPSETAGWSAQQQYKAEMARVDAEIAPLFERFQKQDVLAVAADPEAQAMGQRLFLTYCAQCHGADARGSKGFPNLADGDWLYGGDPAVIKATITNGRHGVMPAFSKQLGGDGVQDVANYVRSLSGLAHDSLRAQRGRDSFKANCVACHGADGTGNQALGAPNLADKTWLYGSSLANVTETITKGRENQMPAFGELLGEGKIHLLSAYVLSLSAR